MEKIEELQKMYSTDIGTFRVVGVNQSQKQPILQIETCVGVQSNSVWFPFNALNQKEWVRFLRDHNGVMHDAFWSQYSTLQI